MSRPAKGSIAEVNAAQRRIDASKPVVRVAFRVERSGQFKGDVTAVLPDLEANPGRWVCYVHIGQHSECSREWYYGTRPATDLEACTLLAELTQIYDDCTLRVVKRINAVRS